MHVPTVKTVQAEILLRSVPFRNRNRKIEKKLKQNENGNRMKEKHNENQRERKQIGNIVETYGKQKWKQKQKKTLYSSSLSFPTSFFSLSYVQPGNPIGRTETPTPCILLVMMAGSIWTAR